MEKSKIREYLLKFKDILLRTSFEECVVNEVFDDVLKYYPENKKKNNEYLKPSYYLLRNKTNGSEVKINSFDIKFDVKGCGVSSELKIKFLNDEDAFKAMSLHKFQRYMTSREAFPVSEIKSINKEVELYDVYSDGTLDHICTLYNVFPDINYMSFDSTYMFDFEWQVFNRDNIRGVEYCENFRAANRMVEQHYSCSRWRF